MANALMLGHGLVPASPPKWGAGEAFGLPILSSPTNVHIASCELSLPLAPTWKALSQETNSTGIRV